MRRLRELRRRMRAGTMILLGALCGMGLLAPGCADAFGEAGRHDYVDAPDRHAADDEVEDAGIGDP